MIKLSKNRMHRILKLELELTNNACEIAITIINMGLKFRRQAGSPSNKVAWAEAYHHAKWHLDPCSHLAATDMGRKLGGGAMSLWGRGSWLPTCGQGRDLPAS